MTRSIHDLSPIEFRNALTDHGFVHLPGLDRYVDIQSRQVGRYLEPVKNAGKTLRRATIAALLAARAERNQAQTLIRAANDRRQKLAGKIAPQVLPPCRADLKAAAAIAQLADDYLSRLASAGCVGFGDLLQMGWSADQLKQHGDAARAVADRKQSMVLA